MNIFKKSCLITYIGIILGVLAMYFAFCKIACSEVDVVRYALICLMFSGVCDMFDGKFARCCKRTEEEKEFGIQLDSLADTFCFLVVPVVIMLALRLDSLPCLLIYMYFIIAGVTRLGYFNVKADTDKVVDYYTGVPVTTTAIVFPLVGLLHTLVTPKTFGIILIALTAIIGFLFNFKIKVPKFTSKWYYIILSILAVIGAILMVIL